MFDALHRRHQATDAILYAFDPLELDGDDLRLYPFAERKARLAKLVGRSGRGSSTSQEPGQPGDGAATRAFRTDGTMTGRRFPPPWRAARLSWRNSIGSISGWVAPGGFHAFAHPFAFPDRWCAAWRNAGGFRAIAEQLSMVFQEPKGRFTLLPLHQL